LGYLFIVPSSIFFDKIGWNYLITRLLDLTMDSILFFSWHYVTVSIYLYFANVMNKGVLL